MDRNVVGRLFDMRDLVDGLGRAVFCFSQGASGKLNITEVSFYILLPIYFLAFLTK
jgi:hypothetical protein